MNFFENPSQLRQAIDFLFQYSVVYDWGALVSDKTPCCSYRDVIDPLVQPELKTAISEFYDSLALNEKRALNREVSLLLGERFFVRRSALIRLLCRLLSNGDPRDDKEIIKKGLQIQIEQRKQLLATL